MLRILSARWDSFISAYLPSRPRSLLVKKQTKAAKAGSTHPFVQRVSGKISSKQYVRGLDQRVSDRRKETASHRRAKSTGA